jgi:acetamidase/formamidase/AraC-like DNA-binding protein
MVLRAFTSESYSGDDRSAAWQDVLGAVGLQSQALGPHGGHATAVSRDAPGLVLARFAAGPQHIGAARQRAELPLVLLPQDDGIALKMGGVHQIVPAGHLLVLPRQGDWRLGFQHGLRAVALAVDAEAFRGRKVVGIEVTSPRLVPRAGLADVLARALEGSAVALEHLTADAWETIGQGLAEMTLSLVREVASASTDARRSASQAALLQRICQTIERRLDDPQLTPSRVAEAEGISERYLQKLFEATGDHFSHYLRERRLQRACADLVNPAMAQSAVSEIAFRYGFNDAAHFSRAFRERFGMSPRAFRQQEAERANPQHCGQRGWPRAASTRLLSQPHRAVAAGVARIGSAAAGPVRAPRHHHLAIDASRVHWGYFSRSLRPQLEIASGDTVTVETLTQHASDDPERMIAGDAGAESVFAWTRDTKAVDRRGAGPLDASIYGRGAGEGFGVHICTGPIAVKDAEPGDVLEVRIRDIAPRRGSNPRYAGRVFGSSVAAWWGYHYGELLSPPQPRETVTIYEIFADDPEPHARAVYSYRWEAQADPFGVVHTTYDYPGVPVDIARVKRRNAVLDGVRIPLRPHFGVIAVAPREADLVDSVPPAYFGGNLDNWRLGQGAAVYLPVSVPGALLSIGDPHAAQGDGELGGTAIECSMTGTFEVTLHKKTELAGKPFADVTYPLIETPTEWVLTGFSHPNYLAEFGAQGQSEVYATSSLDLAMKDAFRKMRRFLMTTRGLTEDEAIALMSAAVDFGVTQVVDGNWGVHAILSKRLFAETSR